MILSVVDASPSSAILRLPVSLGFFFSLLLVLRSEVLLKRGGVVALFPVLHSCDLCPSQPQSKHAPLSRL